MIDVKAEFSGGLNLDDAFYAIPKNGYVDALNITRDAVSSAGDMAITNVVGNRQTFYDLPKVYKIRENITNSGVTNQITFYGPDIVPTGTTLLIQGINAGNPIDILNYQSTAPQSFSDFEGEVISEITANAIPGLISVTFVDRVLIITLNTAITTYTNAAVGSTLTIFNKCIGAYANTVREKVIYFIYNEYGQHEILEFDTQTEAIVPLLQNLYDSDNVDILGFTLDRKICSINIFNRDEGDLLYFIDTEHRPTGFDIEKFRTSEYVPVTRDIIDVCKRPSLEPPTWVYKNDSNRKSNNLRDKFFKFKTRYVYDDLSKSVCSPISKVVLPLNVNNLDFTNIITNNNYIRLEVSTGDKDVKEIEILMSYVNKTNNWSDFQLVETLSKEIKYSFFTDLVSASQEVTRITFYGTPIPYTEIKIIYLFVGLPIVVAQTVVQPGWSIDDIIADLLISATITASVDGNSIILTSDPTDPLNPDTFDNVEINYQVGTDNVDVIYNFYNDSVYPTIDINESIQLFDYVPDKAKAQELANGNVLLYGAITEGYDKDLSPNVLITQNTFPVDVGNYGQGALRITPYDYSQTNGLTKRNRTDYIFNGLPPVGTVITIRVVISPSAPVVLTTYTTVAGDTTSSIVFNLHQNIATQVPPVSTFDTNYFIDRRPFTLAVVFLQTQPYKHSSITIALPSSGLAANPISTFLFNTERNLGIAYFDQKGKTNGILFNQKIVTPSYSENMTGEVLLPYFNIKIYHQPPIWAKSFQFYLTQENTQFLEWYSLGANTTDAEYVFFDIGSLPKQQELFPTTATVCSWAFQEGDRVRIIKDLDSNFVYTDDYDTSIIGIIVDPIINNTQVVGTYIKVAKIGAFSGAGVFSPINYIQLQIYRKQQPPNNQIYYEYGEQYYILDAGTTDRVHSGMTLTQNFLIGDPAEFDFYNGDVYYKERKAIFFPGTGVANYFVFDRNISDNYNSAVNSISGRTNIIDTNAKESFYPTLVRFGQAYQPNTNINGLPRFYTENFDEYDYSFGDIERLKTRDRFVRVFQKLKVGMVPLYQQMVKTPSSENLVISDKLINPIQYYMGDVGIGDNPESLASYNYADFFTSNIKGAICRVSQDGVEFISITKKVNSWANVEVGDSAGRFMVGVIDQRLSNYILALDSTLTSTQKTIVFDQEIGNFETFLTMYPEMMVSINVTLISWLNGRLWIHNNSPYNTFYGNPTDQSYIKPVFAGNQYQKKTFLALSEVASEVWDVPEMVTDLNTYGTTKQRSNLVPSDFLQLEGTFEASIKRDQNSPGGVLNGDTMKGKYLIPTIRKTSASNLVALNIVSCKYIDSPLTNT